MKIVLIPNPVIEEGQPSPYMPLGVLALATVLRNDGFDAEILDVNAICEDPSFQGMTEAIVAAKPDVVGFSTWCNYYLDLMKIAKRIRERLPDVKILFGGVQATHTDLETIEAFPQVDVVARGECDRTISEIISAIHDPDKLRRVRGVTFMGHGAPVRTPNQGPVGDLDALPLPDYSLLTSMSEIDRVGVDVGRGCPFRCGYCVSNSIGEGKFRLRSVENVDQNREKSEGGLWKKLLSLRARSAYSKSKMGPGSLRLSGEGETGYLLGMSFQDRYYR